MSCQIIAGEKDFAVLYKAPGVVTQGSDSAHNLLAQARGVLDWPQVYPVHRLDAATSGLVLVANSAASCAELSAQFAQRKVEKYYLALLDRKPKKKQGLIKGDMAKSRQGSWKLLPSQQNPALTQFFSYGLTPELRLAVLKPLSGKTHQIRVAMKALAAPVIGDTRYGGTDSDRLYLHAYSLAFSHAGKRWQYTAAPKEGVLFAHNAVRDKLQSLGDLAALAWPQVG